MLNQSLAVLLIFLPALAISSNDDGFRNIEVNLSYDKKTVNSDNSVTFTNPMHSNENHLMPLSSFSASDLCQRLDFDGEVLESHTRKKLEAWKWFLDLYITDEYQRANGRDNYSLTSFTCYNKEDYELSFTFESKEDVRKGIVVYKNPRMTLGPFIHLQYSADGDVLCRDLGHQKTFLYRIYSRTNDITAGMYVNTKEYFVNKTKFFGINAGNKPGKHITTEIACIRNGFLFEKEEKVKLRHEILGDGSQTQVDGDESQGNQ